MILSMGTVAQTLLTIAVSCSALLVFAGVFHWRCVRRIPGRDRRRRADVRRRRLVRRTAGWAWWGMLAGIGIMCLAFVPMVLFVYLDVMLHSQIMIIPLVPGYAIMFVAGVIWSRRRRTFFRRVEREGFRVCPDCGYSLAGHAEGGHCPECGYTFTPESLIEDWRDVYKVSLKRWPKS